MPVSGPTDWGQTQLFTSGSVSTPLLFQGQYRDSETGFYYLRANYYDPATKSLEECGGEAETAQMTGGTLGSWEAEVGDPGLHSR